MTIVHPGIESSVMAAAGGLTSPDKPNAGAARHAGDAATSAAARSEFHDNDPNLAAVAERPPLNGDGFLALVCA